jgi:hypothetical protein
MKLDKNSLNTGLSWFKVIKIELFRNGVDLKIYHPASDGVVGVESVILAGWSGKFVPKILMGRKTLYKLAEELEEDKSKTKRGK